MKQKLFVTIFILLAVLAATSGRAFASGSATSTLSTSTGSTSTSSYAPRLSDASLKTGPAYVDMSKSRLIVSNTLPVKVEAVIAGNLPDACHMLRIAVSTSVDNIINIHVYSVFNPAVGCITMLQPFSVTVPLGTFSSGSYTVLVNGLKLGTFSIGSSTSSAVLP